MAEKLVTALTAILGVSLLAVHAASKRHPEPEDVAKVASQLQRNEAWQGKPAPEFEVRTLDGETFRLSDHVGREVLILNFFATWCGPCKTEMPELTRLGQEMAGRPLALLGIDAEEKKDLVEAFVRDVGIAFPVAIDDTGDIRKAFGVDSFPTTILIGPDGAIRLYQVGAVLNADVAFRDLLDTAFAEIAAGKGIGRDAFLAGQPKAGSGDAASVGRAHRIAAGMACPCGCDDKVATCKCSTAKAIQARLASGLPEGRSDAEVVRDLNREFCVKGGR